MANNLLDKSSIILTSTAYDNGKALCVKPSDGSGDFDFSRNSAATRVNAQGLVENVQILSSNLVQNPSFSEEGSEEVSNGSFSQEGVQLITNGDFATDTAWAKNPNWTISGGTANCDGTSDGSFFQGSVIQDNKQYLVTYTLSNLTQGGLRIQLSGTQGVLRTLNGTYTEYITSGSNPSGRVSFECSSSPIGSIDNVSVREVAQDWDLGTGWSIGENKVVGDGTMGANVFGQTVGFTQGNTYKFSFTIEDYISGSIYIREPFNGYLEPVNSNGNHSFYYVAGASNQLDFRGNSFIGSITNISVKEVGQNWTLGTGWEIGDSVAIATDAVFGSELADSTTLTAAKKYSVSFVVSNYVKGTVRAVVGNAAGSDVSSNGTFKSIITSSNTSSLRLQAWAGGSGTSLSISNISLIEITTDTSLPRINYEGFSYQDALGSEEVVNGGFDSDTAWTKGTTWSIGGGFASATENDGSYLYQANICEIGKKYKFTFDVTESSGVPQCVSLFNVWYDSTALAIGSYSVIHTAVSTSGIRFRCKTGGTGSFAIDNVSVKEYLGQEVVPDSGCGSWLWEPQTTQLLPYSEDFSQWNLSGSITLTSGQLAPDGTLGATKISGTLGSSSIYVGGVVQNSTRSIYARTVSGTGTAKLMSYFGNTNNLFTLTEKWQRFELNNSVSSGGGNFYAADFRDNAQTLSEFIIWGANATNNQDYATSYIPTEGSTVTRNQDLCNNGGSLATINSTEGTLYAEIASLSNEVPSNYISLSDGTYSNRISILYSVGTNIIRAFLRVGGAVQADMTFTVSDIRDFHKVAFLYKENNFALWIDGVEVSTDTSGSTMPSGTLSKLSFSEINTAGGLFRGKTKCLAVWKEALSDQELTELTTI